jgi:cytochrome b involved in lipid metabolism
LACAGRDATEAFNLKNHSEGAKEALSTMKIGRLLINDKEDKLSETSQLILLKDFDQSNTCLYY